MDDDQEPPSKLFLVVVIGIVFILGSLAELYFWLEHFR